MSVVLWHLLHLYKFEVSWYFSLTQMRLLQISSLTLFLPAVWILNNHFCIFSIIVLFISPLLRSLNRIPPPASLPFRSFRWFLRMPYMHPCIHPLVLTWECARLTGKSPWESFSGGESNFAINKAHVWRGVVCIVRSLSFCIPMRWGR